MSGLSRTIEEEHPSLSSEQLQQVKQVDQYLADNRVHEILNVRYRLCRRQSLGSSRPVRRRSKKDWLPSCVP